MKNFFQYCLYTNGCATKYSSSMMVQSQMLILSKLVLKDVIYSKISILIKFAICRVFPDLVTYRYLQKLDVEFSQFWSQIKMVSDGLTSTTERDDDACDDVMMRSFLGSVTSKSEIVSLYISMYDTL